MKTVEKARITDVPQMHQIINSFANKGEMLARPLSEIYESIRDFFVVKEDDKVIGCAALHVSWSDLAEIRSVAVAQEYQHQGIGDLLVAACIQEAEDLRIKTVFCFTYQPAFFKKHRFTDIDKMELPRKVWTDCYRCPKFPNCDESALIRHLEAVA
ncbi:N-acetyltransferase [Chloroflexota bacterium]